eukprot:TRINITY_DN2148_c0_g1_i1.p1 TRINITY_DN2148_c0_g1~~TRINITY_DN2148_c0_g1_i1.p1  ORF type:complete len:406 (+),score=116.24 TRINITY_DN2148_c0_g1_i1:65-1282(+)
MLDKKIGDIGQSGVFNYHPHLHTMRLAKQRNTSEVSSFVRKIVISFLFLIAISPIIFTLYLHRSTHLLDTSYIEQKFDEFKHINLVDTAEDNMADDVTFLFAVVNMGRKDHLGKSGSQYTFEDDYLRHLKNIIRFMYPQKIRVYVEKRYAEVMKDVLTENVQMLHLEIEDLTGFKYYDDIEAIRTSGWWAKMTPWLSDVPQGYSNLYNPLVMQKLLLLKKLADDNPFKTKHFAWLDSGGICTPSIKNFGVEKFVEKLKYFTRSNKLLATRSQYAGSEEIHGCQRTLLAKITGGNHPAFVTKGWLMAGTKEALDNVVPLYDRLLNQTLSMGCLGTEETILSLGQYVAPQLFRSFVNGKPDNPFKSGDFCYFINSRADYAEDELTFQEKWMLENKMQRQREKPEKAN